MATEPAALDQKDDTPTDAPRPSPRTRGNPIDAVMPTCMFWAMVVGLSILLGIMLIWGISNLDKIGG